MNEHVTIISALEETNNKNDNTRFLKSGMGSLLETINGTPKTTYILRRMRKTWRWLYIDFLSTKKGIFVIQLVKRPSMGCGQGNEHMNQSHLGNK